MLGYLNGISFLGYDFQSYPNSQKISLNILTYPIISYHIPTYPKISSGANSQKPTRTTGRTRATPERLNGAVRSGTAGRGPNQDHWPGAGRQSYASTHAHLGTAGRGTRKATTGCERAGGAV